MLAPETRTGAATGTRNADPKPLCPPQNKRIPTQVPRSPARDGTGGTQKRLTTRASPQRQFWTCCDLADIYFHLKILKKLTKMQLQINTHWALINSINAKNILNFSYLAYLDPPVSQKDETWLHKIAKI